MLLHTVSACCFTRCCLFLCCVSLSCLSCRLTLCCLSQSALLTFGMLLCVCAGCSVVGGSLGAAMSSYLMADSSSFRFKHLVRTPIYTSAKGGKCGLCQLDECPDQPALVSGGSSRRPCASPPDIRNGIRARCNGSVVLRERARGRGLRSVQRFRRRPTMLSWNFAQWRDHRSFNVSYTSNHRLCPLRILNSSIRNSS